MPLWNSTPASTRQTRFRHKPDERTQTLQSPSLALSGKTFMSTILIGQGLRPIGQMSRGGESHTCAWVCNYLWFLSRCLLHSLLLIFYAWASSSARKKAERNLVGNV